MSILLVRGGPAMQRAVYEEEQRGYWSAALGCALEKYGARVATAGPEALADGARLARHAVVLVARQPAGTWSEELVTRLAGLRGGAIVEGPLPAVLAERLGVRDVGAAEIEGAFQVTDAALREAGSAHGAVPGGTLGTGTSRPVDLHPEQRWPATPAPITQRQAAAWRARGWDVRRWALGDPAPDVLADWIAPGAGHERMPAIVRREGLIGCCAGIFAFLGQSHTVAPYEGGEHRNWPRVDSVEALLLGLIDLLHTRAGRPRVSILPWPAGWSWSMHVRHDVDRTLPSRHAEAVAARHRDAGTAATWYWRSRHLALRRGRPVRGSDGNTAARTIASTSGHEVALHTERLWDGGADERETVEAVLAARIRGSSAHGDPTCFRFQGAPNLMWAESQGLAYTELISHAHSRPHRAALLEPDGAITLTRTLCLPHHASFDRTMQDGDTLSEQVSAEAARFQNVGGLLQILNHPDINLAQLFGLLEQLPTEGRWNATAAEATAWWSATHVGEAIRVAETEDGALTVAADSDVHGLQLQIRDPTGALTVRTASVPAGGRATLG